MKLFVNRGARSGIDEDDLRWALTEGAVIPEDGSATSACSSGSRSSSSPTPQAELALERLDGTKLKGKQIRVEYAKD